MPEDSQPQNAPQPPRPPHVLLPSGVTIPRPKIAPLPANEDRPANKARPPLRPKSPDLLGTAFYEVPDEFETVAGRAKVVSELQTVQASLRERMQALLTLPAGLKPEGPGRSMPDRASGMYPFLLLRSWAGADYDYGARPFGGEYWHSPDILITDPLHDGFAPDQTEHVFDPHVNRALAPESPSIIGRTYNIWVHVWNLGQFAAYSVQVRVWAWDNLGVWPGWVDHSLDAQHPDFDPTHRARYLGGTYLDLGERTSSTAHRAVLATQWTPASVPEHLWDMQALVAVVSCFADPVPPTATFSPYDYRHVAVRGSRIQVMDMPRIRPRRI